MERDRRRSGGGLLDKPGGIFIRRSNRFPTKTESCMQTVARVIISDYGRHAGRADGAARPRRKCRAAVQAHRGRRTETAGAAEMPPHDLTVLQWHSAVSPTTAANTSSPPRPDRPRPRPG